MDFYLWIKCGERTGNVTCVDWDGCSWLSDVVSAAFADHTASARCGFALASTQVFRTEQRFVDC